MMFEERYALFTSRCERKAFFESEILRQMPRLLSMMDRCPVSASRGCFDREYWAWATKDFANIDMQRGVSILAYLYTSEFPGNIYYRRSAIREWILFGVSFWIQRQNRKGSFDHLYLNENSWMATAFTLLDMVDTFKMVAGEADAAFKESWLEAMRKAGYYLIRRDENHGFISNHRIGAACGLMGLYNLTNEKVFKERAWEIMEDVYAHQSPEGWFLEYEGADPGYQTLEMHYLAYFFLKTNHNVKLLQSVSRSLEFHSYFLHPDGSIGGEYGSRNCPHFFPGGFEIFADNLPTAEAMARLGAVGLAEGRSCGLADADDRNFIPLATSYILAHRALCSDGERQADKLPCERVFERIWRESGLYIRSDEKSYLIFGAAKGGVIKLFNKQKRRLVHSSCGYSADIGGLGLVSTLFWSSFPRFKSTGLEPGTEQPLALNREIAMEAEFYHFNPVRLMLPLSFLLFRIFNITIGRIAPINDFVRKEFIKKYLKARKGSGMQLRRVITVSNTTLKINDKIIPPEGILLRGLREHGFLSTVYMASARYFRAQDLDHSWSSEVLQAEPGAAILNTTNIDTSIGIILK